LEDVAFVIAYGAVPLDSQVLHAFDQTALELAGVGCFDCGVDEPFAPGHAVEVEFLGFEAVDEAGADLAARRRQRTVGGKAGQCAAPWHFRHALSLQLLLAELHRDEAVIHIRPLGACSHHQVEEVLWKLFAESLVQTQFH